MREPSERTSEWPSTLRVHLIDILPNVPCDHRKREGFSSIFVSRLSLRFSCLLASQEHLRGGGQPSPRVFGSVPSLALPPTDIKRSLSIRAVTSDVMESQSYASA